MPTHLGLGEAGAERVVEQQPPRSAAHRPGDELDDPFAWYSSPDWVGWRPDPLIVSPRRQASYLRRSYNILAANRNRLKIAGMVWYSWRDLPGGIWFSHTGLFTQSLDPKPSW